MSDYGRLTVEGKGAIHVVPDVTRLEISIYQWFPDYTTAYAQARENSAWMVKILEFNHKPGKLAKNTRFDISDHLERIYDEDGNIKGHKKKGFDLAQGIKVDLPIDNVLVNNIVRGIGKFIPSAQINIGYTLQDERPSQLKMIGRAVSDAKEKAEIMLKAAGCQLGGVLSIQYGHSNIQAYSQARNIHSNAEAKSSTADSLDITPDDLVMSDTVEVVFQIINP